MCVTSIQGFNSDARVVAGKESLSLRYHFYEGRLYKIAIGFYPLDFSPVLNAFTEKFGAPAHIGADAYQNAFGAKWEAAVVTWRKGRESVTLKESPAMGPGQDHYNSLRPTTAVFLQDDVKPPSVPGKVDF